MAKQQAPIPKLIGIHAAAAILKVTRTRVLDLIKEGHFEVQKVGGSWVFSERSVKAFARTYKRRPWGPGQPMKKNR